MFISYNCHYCLAHIMEITISSPVKAQNNRTAEKLSYYTLLVPTGHHELWRLSHTERGVRAGERMLCLCTVTMLNSLDACKARLKNPLRPNHSNMFSLIMYSRKIFSDCQGSISLIFSEKVLHTLFVIHASFLRNWALTFSVVIFRKMVLQKTKLQAIGITRKAS